MCTNCDKSYIYHQLKDTVKCNHQCAVLHGFLVTCLSFHTHPVFLACRGQEGQHSIGSAKTGTNRCA